jgi:hypothetical protein
MAQLLVAHGATDPLLLGSEFDGVLPQLLDLRPAQGRFAVPERHVERSFHLERGITEAAQPVALPDIVGPELGRPRGEHPLSSVLGHAPIVGTGRRRVFDQKGGAWKAVESTIWAVVRPAGTGVDTPATA